MKKILSTILTAAMLFSCIPAFSFAAAEDKSYELVQNSKMEEDIEGWTTYNASTASIAWQAGGAFDSKGCIKVTGAGRGNVTSNYGPTQNIRLTKGETYTVSADMKMAAGTGSFKIYILDSTGPAIHMPTGTMRYDVGTTWTHVEFEYTFTGKNASEVDVQGYGKLAFGSTNNTDYYVDNISIKGHGNVDNTYVDPLAAPIETSLDAFADVDGHWAESTINLLNLAGVANGVGGAAYAPEQDVTRGEFAALVMRALKLEEHRYAGSFADVAAEDWYADAMQTAYDLNLIPGAMVEGGRVSPGQPITRAEAGAIMGLVGLEKNVGEKREAITFADAGSIPSWAEGPVRDAYTYGLISGFPDGSFAPQKTITRAEAAEMAKNIYELEDRLAFYVDYASGRDENDGTLAAPFKTLTQAKKAVAQYNGDMKHNLYVFLKAGEHSIAEAVEFGPDDSGTNGYDVVYTSYGDGKAELMGGKHVTGWELYDAEHNIYVADVGAVESRQLYVDGIKATRSRTKRPVGKDRILPNALGNDFEVREDGILSSEAYLADLEKPEELEIVFARMWAMHYAPVADVTLQNGKAFLTVEEPIHSYLYNDKYYTSDVQYLWLENAYEFVDEQREWYLDSDAGKLYYKPAYFEDMNAADVVLPVAERLINMEGDVDEETENVVHNIVFENLAFHYTTWLRPGTGVGHHSAQNNWIRDRSKTLYPGNEIIGLADGCAVRVRNSRYVDFYECEFSKLGFAGLQMVGSVRNTDIVGNKFSDIQGNAVNIGDVNRYVPEVHSPVSPKNYVSDLDISNNYFREIGREEHSGTAIGISYPKNTTIHNNEFTATSYAGVHVGGLGSPTRSTGMDNFVIENNYFHDLMSYNLYDAGAIYICSGNGATDFDRYTLIQNNYFKSYWGWPSVLYNDTGTVGTKWTRNVVDQSEVNQYNYKFSEQARETQWWYGTLTDYWQQAVDNYSTIDYRSPTEEVFMETSPKHLIEEPHLYPEADWPDDALGIIAASGLEDRYLELYPNEAQVVKVTSDKKIRSESRGYVTEPITGLSYNAGDADEIRIGDTFRLDVEVEGRLDTGITPEAIYYICHDEDIAKVDETGLVTALSSGVTAVDVLVKSGEILIRNEVEFVVEDGVGDVEFNTDANVVMVEGTTRELIAKVNAMSGRSIEEFDVEIVSDNENVLSVDGAKYTAEAEGTATLTVAVNIGDYSEAYEFNIEVIDSDYQAYSFDFGSEISRLRQWNFAPFQYVTVTANDDGTFKVKSDNKTSYVNTNDTYQDAVFEFDFGYEEQVSGYNTIFCIRNADRDVLYNRNDHNYLLYHTANAISLVKYVSGVRTDIYGTTAGYTPVAGPAIPFQSEPGRIYHYEVGTINVDGGVRIFCKVDGETIFDYVDTAEDAITEPGYFSFRSMENIIIGPTTK